MNRIKTFFQGLIKNVWFGIHTSFLASKFYFSMKMIILISTTVVPLVNIWLWKEVLNGIASYRANGQRLPLYLGIYLILQMSVYLLSQFGDYVNERYSDEVVFYIETVMMEKTSRMDLSFFDSAKMGDKVRHARSNFGILTETTWTVFEILSSLINVILTLVIVCAYEWWIGLVTFVLLIPYILYNKKRSEIKLKMEKEQLRDKRKIDYFCDVFFNNDVQFEMKLNDISSYFKSKYQAVWKKLFDVNRREDIRYHLINSLVMIMNVTGELLVLVVSIFHVINQKIGIGDLQYNLSMVSRLRSQSQELIKNVNNFLNNNTRLIELQEFLDIPIL